MKKNPLLFAVFFLVILSINAYSQDFNLLNPSNELYLFSAVDEGANAFRYNPAVLGLNHRMNATINAFWNQLSGKSGFSEYDFMVNFGHFGISYRHANEVIAQVEYYSGITVDDAYYDAPAYMINTYSLGFGIGNKAFSGGLLLEMQTRDNWEGAEDFTGPNPRYRFGFGLLYRPSKFLSTSFVYKNREALTIHGSLGNRFTFGAAFRPLGSDRLTFTGDFSFAPREGVGTFENRILKAGAVLKVLPGFSLTASYMNVKDHIRSEFVNIGFGVDLPNFSLRYNNSLNNVGRTYEPATVGYYGAETSPYVFNPNSKYRTIGSMISLSFSAEKKHSLVPEKKKVIELTLSGSLQDYNTEDVFFGILGKGKRSVHEVIADIDYAASDPSVKGMLLRIYPLATGRIDINAQLEELAGALERFKAKKKNITAYLVQDAGPAEYYIATYADNIVLPPEALLFYGLSVNVFNYRQFLEKYGVELQNFYAGKYKLTFQGILDSTTEQGKEVIERMLDVVYDKMMNRLISSRNITIDDYMKTKISQPMSGRDAMRLGLVDKLGWYEDAKKLSEDVTRISNVVNRVNRSEWDNEWGEPDEVAIIGVYGSMTTGESQPPPPVTLPIPYVGGRSTGSETVVRQLEDAFGNPKVKVVILRIDSGGGSVLGSAEINSAIIRLKKKFNKPFYVSMGGSAASGGYYVSVNADKIFADELTITGSIGVWTTRPNVDSLLKEQKIKVENFKRGENSDIATFYRKLTPSEIEIIQGIIDYYYERFISAISEGRKMSPEEVEQVAQGRVWLGSDAINKKLIDEIGGLYETIEYAKKKSHIGKRYKMVYYAVPGGGTISDVITSSVVEYLQSNLLRLTGFDGNEDNIEIKY